MTSTQLQILQHALGRDQYGDGSGDRNHYAAAESDIPDLEVLLAAGYVVELAKVSWFPDRMFRVTSAGKVAMREACPPRPKVSAGAKRWAEYSSYSDAFDCTFREWLDIRKTDWYQRMKAGLPV